MVWSKLFMKLQADKDLDIDSLVNEVLEDSRGSEGAAICSPTRSYYGGLSVDVVKKAIDSLPPKSPDIVFFMVGRKVWEAYKQHQRKHEGSITDEEEGSWLLGRLRPPNILVLDSMSPATAYKVVIPREWDLSNALMGIHRAVESLNIEDDYTIAQFLKANGVR